MPRLEVADIFRAHGPTWRHQERGHFSLGQLKVMSAVEHCRSAWVGGHALRWLEARAADLLPVDDYHVVFTLPAPLSALAYTNKELMYGLLFDVAASTLRTIAADPKHLGAGIGATLLLHTWGSALTHHPHVHGIVPGGGLALDADRWVPCKPGFFLSVRVLSRLFRRRFLEELAAAHGRGQLLCFGEFARLTDVAAFTQWLAPLRKLEWVVYAKRPFAGPEVVLAYLSRYAHRVAISNSRLLAMDDRGITFRWKDYRAAGRTRQKTMTLTTEEFMRRFLLHVPAPLAVRLADLFSAIPRFPPWRIIQRLPPATSGPDTLRTGQASDESLTEADIRQRPLSDTPSSSPKNLQRLGRLCRLSSMGARKSNVRMSLQTLRVLEVFLDTPTDELSGADVIKRGGLASGTLYPILFRLESAGWFVSRWEKIDPATAGRPRRRLYRLTPTGLGAAPISWTGYRLSL